MRLRLQGGDLRTELNPGTRERARGGAGAGPAREQAIEKKTRMDFARSLLQNNQEFYGFIREGIAIEWRAGSGETHHAHARAMDFGNGQGADGKPNNRFRTARDLLPRLISGEIAV